MKQSTAKLDLAVERLTTGYKINHAKDNAANYSISTNMTTKLGARQTPTGLPAACERGVSGLPCGGNRGLSCPGAALPACAQRRA